MAMTPSLISGRDGKPSYISNFLMADLTGMLLVGIKKTKMPLFTFWTDDED